MGKKRIKAVDLTPAAVVERAKSMATDWMWALSLQYDRIVAPRAQDQRFHPFNVQHFHEADVHFFMIALRRLRQVATTIEQAPEQWPPVRRAIDDFDRKLPWLKRLRDVFEHLEDYAVDSNLRHTETSRRELQVWSAKENGLEWLSYRIEWREAVHAAEELYVCVKTAHSLLVAQTRQESIHRKSE